MPADFCPQGCYWECEHRAPEPWTVAKMQACAAARMDVDYSPGIDYRGPMRRTPLVKQYLEATYGIPADAWGSDA